MARTLTKVFTHSGATPAEFGGPITISFRELYTQIEFNDPVPADSSRKVPRVVIWPSHEITRIETYEIREESKTDGQ